jgi:Ca2+-binding EF-hand superfamily protein
MKKILTALLVCGLFMPLMTGVTAQEKKGKSPEERFAALDKNNDKKLSKEEFLAPVAEEKKGKAGDRFDMADKNKDGFLSLEEYKEMPMGKKKA